MFSFSSTPESHPESHDESACFSCFRHHVFTYCAERNINPFMAIGFMAKIQQEMMDTIDEVTEEAGDECE